ncbi:UNVERIFIED_CONTAM: hypothetical protein GTU68_046248 [Idotea baltica]|nr:hypothetical protein [Idotea baltica]
MTFTIGRGNELCVSGIRSLAAQLIGQDVAVLMQQPVEMSRRMTSDSQLRWVGPEKGVIHLAAAAVINAVWDLWAKIQQKPVWQLVADMPPEQFASCVDFRYLTDEINSSQAIELLTTAAVGKNDRLQILLDKGYPSYTTSAGWLGYSDEQLKQKCADLKQRGWNHFKIKVGRDLDDDRRRCGLLRSEMGEFNPWFVEEPTSPDDILGHAAIAKAVNPIRIATGEMCHNRIMFKQFLQADAMQVCQLDSCRLGGVNEVLAVLLLAEKFKVPVCPHAGGVGLCEYVQHLSMIDYLCVSGTTEDRVTEYSDHLHEHVIHPVIMENGHYQAPKDAGYSVQFTEAAKNGFAC